MSLFQDKVAAVANDLKMAGHDVDPTALDSCCHELFGLFATQVPTGQPTAKQDADTLQTVGTPGQLHNLTLRRVVRRHFGIGHVEPVAAALLDAGKNITVDDAHALLTEYRASPPPNLP